MGAIQGTVLRLSDLSDKDRARWRELADAAVDPNPFFDLDYVEPLARGLGTVDEVHVAVAADGDRWLACMPVHPDDAWHRIRLPAVSTWRGHLLYGLLGTPLMTADCPEEALLTFARTVGSVRSHPTFVAFDWLAEESPTTAALWQALGTGKGRGPLRFDRFERAVVRRRPENTYVEETLSPKHRRELRRQRRKLAEAIDDEPVMVDLSAEGSAPQQFVDVEAASRKAYKGTMLADDAGHTEFFLEMCRRFAARGRLEIFALRGGGQTIAIKVNLVAPSTVFGLKIAYAPEWADYSPGIQLELDALKFFHDHTEAQVMDSCADANNAMANRLLPDRRGIVTLALPTDGPLSLVARPVLRAARTYRNRRS